MSANNCIGTLRRNLTRDDNSEICKDITAFAALTEKQIRRGVHRSTRELEQAIRHYIETTNARPTPFVWTKTADEILASVARFCKHICDSGR